MLYAVTVEKGLAAGWIGWLGQTVMIIIFGIASLIIASFMKDSTENIVEQLEPAEEEKA